MSKRQRVSSGTHWEKIAGYARAIRAGNRIYVSGTTATDEHYEIVGRGDPYAQTVYIIQKIERALNELGASLQDVVRTRLYLADAGQWEAVARAHGEYFSEIQPANTLIGAIAIIGEGYLVEMEAEAVIGDDE